MPYGSYLLSVPLILVALGLGLSPDVGESELKDFKVTIFKPNKTDVFMIGVRARVEVDVAVPLGGVLPEHVYADFYRGKMSAGQFTASPAQFSRTRDGQYRCVVMVDVPKKPGTYQLVASIQGKRRVENSPKATMDVKVIE